MEVGATHLKKSSVTCSVTNARVYQLIIYCTTRLANHASRYQKIFQFVNLVNFWG